jgi:hypothetical protein
MPPACLLLAALLAADAVSAAEVDYLRDVKPVLATRCFACHGAVRQKARLRLDAVSLIRKGGRHGPAIVPGKAGQSLLIDAVRGRDHVRMPPEKEGEALAEKDIAALEAWIDQGAKAPEEPIPADPRSHWAFRPPVAPPVHAVGNAANPIDAFITVERDKHGLKPNPPADRATLLRRVYLDLIGLPPTRQELHAFLADTAPDAYEKVVDRLLASPQYGERWGRHWMDVWRYSDPFGNGAEYRYSHWHIWRWRDWIIESLNADKGYDRMVVEMLAGDEIAPADRDTLRATGYLARNWYKFNRNAWMQDTVEHTAAGFLGITLRCCRCHDHKYDPLSQQEYYCFRAFFEPHDVRIDLMPGQPDSLKDGVARVFDATPAAPTYLFVRGDDRMPDKSRALTPGVPVVLGGEPEVREVVFRGAALAPALETAAAEARHKARADITAAESALKTAAKDLAAAGKVLEQFAAGSPPPKPQQTAAFLHDTFAAARPDVWKAISGAWVWEKGRLAQKTSSPFATLVTLKNHPQDLMGRVRFKTTGGGVTSVGFAFDVVGTTAWQAVYTYCQPNASAVQAFHRVGGSEAYPPQGIVPHPFKLNEEITLDFAVRGTLLNVWVNGQLKIAYRLPVPRQPGAFAVWNHEATSEFYEVRLAELPASVRLAESVTEGRPSPVAKPVVLTKADAENAVRSAQRAVALAEKQRTISQAALEAVEARLAADRSRCMEPPAADAGVLALAASAAERRLAVLQAELALASLPPDAVAKKARSDAEQRLAGARAAAAKPDTSYTSLVQLNPAKSTGRRLALARWITRRDNPLTARVAVNHVWMRHFGKPLVPTAANFGMGGKPPTHPALLDWLAVRFMGDGWGMKKLHRLIVTSQTYRLGSQGTDANNLKIDPENRYLWRMNPRRMEAEAVRDSLLAAAGQLDPTRGGPALDVNLGQTSRRRSVYFRFNTEYKIRFLEQFDAPSPSECYERHESVVPQQALALCNSALALSQSRLLARRLTGGGGDFIQAAFEQVLGRAPTAEERSRCERFLREQTALLQSPGRLTPFPAGPDAVTPPAADPAARAREDLVHVLFNHNDFVTIR